MTYWSHDVELAAALIQIPGSDGGPWITHEEAKLLTAKQIISRWERDHHPIRKADGGKEVHWNCTWRLKPEHKKKSNRDATDMARERKVRKEQAIHAAQMILKTMALIEDAITEGDKIQHDPTIRTKSGQPKRRWPSRPWPKRGVRK